MHSNCLISLMLLKQQQQKKVESQLPSHLIGLRLLHSSVTCGHSVTRVIYSIRGGCTVTSLMVILWLQSFIRCEVTSQWRRLGSFCVTRIIYVAQGGSTTPSLVVVLWRESFPRHMVTLHQRQLWPHWDLIHMRVTKWLHCDVTCDCFGTRLTYVSPSDYIVTSFVTALGLNSHTCHKVTTLRRHLWPLWDSIHIVSQSDYTATSLVTVQKRDIATS